MNSKNKPIFLLSTHATTFSVAQFFLVSLCFCFFYNHRKTENKFYQKGTVRNITFNKVPLESININTKKQKNKNK